MGGERPQKQPKQEAAKAKDKIYSNDISMDDIMIGDEIGQGAYAVVKKGIYVPANLTIAIKIYDKSKLEEPQRRKSVKREIKLMEMMDNEFIVKLYGVIETRHHLYILMEYVSGLSLHGYLKLHRNRRLPEDEARRIYQQLMLGLQYCHKKCITHRDIKLENILLDENRNVKFIDFGFSTKIPNEQKVKMFCGTPSYMAPEIVTKQEYSGPPADIWASCVLLFALLCGYFPYKGSTDAELYERICSCECYVPEFLSSEARDFLNCIFQYDAEDRPSADEMFDEPWMRIPIGEKYSTTSSTGVGASKSASQSSEEIYIQNKQPPKLFNKRKARLQNTEMTQHSDKTGSKQYVLSNSPRRKQKEYDSMKLKNPKGSRIKNIMICTYISTKDGKNETEPSKQSSKVSGVSGITHKNWAHTESKDNDIDKTVEVGAVSGIKQISNKTRKPQYFDEAKLGKYKSNSKANKTQNIVFNQLDQSDSQELNHTISDEDMFDKDVLDSIVSLGYPIEEVLRLIQEEDEDMISLYLNLLQENQSHLQAVIPNYMRSKASDWKNYAFLLASPENSSSRSRREKSRNNRVLSYSPKRNKYKMNDDGQPSMSGSGKDKLRFAFYPKEASPGEGKPNSRNRKLIGGRQFSPN